MPPALSRSDASGVPRSTEADQSLQDRNVTAVENKRQFVGESLFLSNDRLSVFFLFRFLHQFHRLPVRYVTRFTFTENAIEHSSSAEQTDMTSVQGSQRAAGNI